MNFLFGPLLWASAAGMAPVIIHMIMRTRPKTISLPTMRFVRRTHHASISKRRIKHYILLAMRIAALLLLVFFFSRPYFGSDAGASADAGPRTVVVVVDNTASMGCSVRGRTFAERGRAIAETYIRRMPDGSRVAVFDTCGLFDTGFLPDPSRAADAIGNVPVTYGDTPLPAGIRRALRLISRAGLERGGEILVITDMTAHSWRGMGRFEIPEGLRCSIIDASTPDTANVSVRRVVPDAHVIPAGGKCGVTVELHSDIITGKLPLIIRGVGHPEERRIVPVSSGQVTAIEALLSAGEIGFFSGSVRIAGNDQFPVDNVRYFTIRVDKPPEVLMVAPVGEGTENGFIMSCLIEASSADGAPRLRLDRVIPSGLSEKEIFRADMIVLAGGTVHDSQWETLEQYVTGGGRLWVTAGPLLPAASLNTSPAQRVLPAVFKGPIRLERPAALRMPPRESVFYEPFASGDNPPLEDVACYQRFDVSSLSSNTVVHLAFADGVPAVVSRSIGDGRVLFWNFSPVREWSNLARLGGQLVIVTDCSRRMLLAKSGRSRMFTWGQEVSVPVPVRGSYSSVSITGPGGTVQSRELFLNQETVSLVPRELGSYRLAFRGGSGDAFEAFSVNVPVSESRLERVDQTAVVSSFPAGSCRILSSARQLEDDSDRDGAGIISLVPICFVALLVFMAAESFFANRFYRKSSSAEIVP